MTVLKKEHWKTPEMTAFLAAVAVGFIVHLFGLVNVVHNIDNIVTPKWGTGAGLYSARWFLQVMGWVLEWAGLAYNLPLLNGLSLVVLVAVAAGFLVNLFGIKNRVSAALIGMILVVYPTITGTMGYPYTTFHYGVGILMAVVAAWVVPRYKLGLVYSAALTSMSMGIYQAYVPMTITIFVLLMIQEALRGQTSLWKLVLRGLYYCAAIGLGTALYFLTVKVMLANSHMYLLEHQGIPRMGQIALSELPGLVVRCYKSFFNVLGGKHTLSNVGALRLGYVLSVLLCLVMFAITLVKKTKKWEMALSVAVLCGIFPLANCFIYLMCPESGVSILMVYAVALPLCAPLIFLEELPQMPGKKLLGKAAGLVAAVVVFFYGYYANVNYSAAYYATLQTENYLNSLMVQVRMTEGFDTEKDWAFLGNIKDPMYEYIWKKEANYAVWVPEYLMNTYSRMDWIHNQLGYNVPLADGETTAALIEDPVVKAMPCWPNQGSIQAVGDTMVIKFQELSQ